jgi:hypothetical protein
MVRLAEAMPKTSGATDRLRGCTGPAAARGMAGDLMQDALVLARITDAAPA